MTTKRHQEQTARIDPGHRSWRHLRRSLPALSSVPGALRQVGSRPQNWPGQVGLDLLAARSHALVDGEHPPGDRGPVELGGARRPAARSSSRRGGVAEQRDDLRGEVRRVLVARSCTPARPSSSTRWKASMSLATTGAPAAIASSRMMPKDSPPVLGAT